jgi:hypothetical protein
LSVLAVLGLSSVSYAQELTTNSHFCVDKHESKRDCIEWAWKGECDVNPEFMHDQCRQSCGLCTPNEDEKGPCEDHHPKCTDWAEKGNLYVNNLCDGHWHKEVDGHMQTGAYIVELCPMACKTCDIHLDDRDIELGIGLPQKYEGMETNKELFNLLKSKVAETRSYIESIRNEEVRGACKMSHPHCARFALSEDCDTHFDHPVMQYGCAAACQTCEKLAKTENGIEMANAMYANALHQYKEE